MSSDYILQVVDAENVARLKGNTSCMSDDSVYDFDILYPGRRLQLQLSKGANHSKYNAVILDSKDDAKSTCMVFIVPQGRDGEWYSLLNTITAFHLCSKAIEVGLKR